MSCEGRAVWHMRVPGVSFAFVFSLKALVGLIREHG